MAHMFLPTSDRAISHGYLDDLDDGPDDHLLIASHIAHTARKIFNSYGDLKRLRESSRVRTRCTPRWATYRHFRLGIEACWGVAAEALALILYYLAVEEKMSGDDIDRYRDVAEYTWYRNAEEEDIDTWHRGDESYEGNPATAPVVFRVLRLAYEIGDRRASVGEPAGSIARSLAMYREEMRRANAPPLYMD
ncbi:unnamed protein product [Peniophora sp. CBMAI 1063]|nr:unnamed protein product [Peniophora sp. CBMAI 1063]